MGTLLVVSAMTATNGSFVSSGCIRLTNEDVEDLYRRVTVGTRVFVLPEANTATSQLRPRHKPTAKRWPEETGSSRGLDVQPRKLTGPASGNFFGP
jgi:hypothetical protein